MLCASPAQAPLKESVPFTSTVLEGEEHGQELLLHRCVPTQDCVALGIFTPTWQRAAGSTCRWCSWWS